MKKTLIAYCSQTGNTRKIAETIYRTVPDYKELRNLSEVDGLDDYGLIFIGFPIYNFEPISQAKDFMKKRLYGRKIAIFVSMALTSAPLNEPLVELYNLTVRNCRESADGATILGIFDCPGELSEKAATALINSNDPQLKRFGMMRDYSIGFPNAKNLKDAELFAREIFSHYLKETLISSQGRF